MKNIVLICLLLLPFIGFSQSTEILPGTVLPQMTTAQRTSIASPINGMLVFDSDTQSYWFRQSGSWVELPKGGSTSNYWQLDGLGGNEIKNTNSGGFWSANPTALNSLSDDVSNPPTAPVNGGGTRMMWIPSRSAFRVGTANAGFKSWDADSIGLFSFASGYEVKAKGYYSTALGYGTDAIGNSSTAIGRSTTASGFYSTSMGYNTDARGSYSTAMGHQTDANGSSSTAMGWLTTASGDNSTAMGKSTTASGDHATAMGQSTTANGNSSTAIGLSTTADGDYATALGLQTTATGSSSTAIGYYTQAIGKYATSMGHYTKANGTYSTAMGYYTEANGNSSTAMGFSNKAKAVYATVIGSFNDDSDSPLSTTSQTDRLFQIGNGTSTTRSNAMTVLRNGNTGIKTVNPDAALEVDGFTKLGTDAPKIKMKKFTGTTSTLQGICVAVTTGITKDKVLDFAVTVEFGSSGLVREGYNLNPNYEFYSYISGTEVRVCTKSANSGLILSQPFKVLVTYEE